MHVMVVLMGMVDRQPLHAIKKLAFLLYFYTDKFATFECSNDSHMICHI